jgi:glyoxylase I family protein
LSECHHCRLSAITPYALTVSNLQRSIEWYERLFDSPPVAINDQDNYRAAMWFEPMFAIHENQHQLEGDVFDEFRIGLDHIAFGCTSVLTQRFVRNI